jgi:hypothetical protein
VPIPFTTLQVGNTVEVKAVPIASVWTAVRIKIET